MARHRRNHYVRCAHTSGLIRLRWPLKLLIRHGSALGAAGATGLLLTLTFWFSTQRVPAIRYCGALIREVAEGRLDCGGINVKHCAAFARRRGLARAFELAAGGPGGRCHPITQPQRSPP
jgi:hypothetical protein